MALTLQDVDRIIKHAQPDLLKRLDLGLWFIAELKATDVITESLSDALKADNLTPYGKITRLLDRIRSGPVERYLKFCQVLQASGQEHILPIMKVDMVSVERQLASSVPMQPSTLDSGGTSTPEGLLFPEQREYYESKLALSPIYEYVSRSPLVHLDDMFTNLQLVNNEKDQGLSKHTSRGEDSEPIHLQDVFKPNGNQVLSIIIEGRPGSGKSTLLRHCAVDWARNKRKTGDRDNNFPLLDKDLLIFVDKIDEAETLDETILNAIKGDKKTKAESLTYMKNFPKRTFLFIDGLDEFLRQEIRNEIFKLAKDCGYNIVVTCRLGHPYLEKEMNCFNRHVRIEGFDSDSMDIFVRRFMSVLSIQKNDPGIQQKSETLCSLLKVKDAQNVYTTPLNCTFLCILYAEGEVADDELASLTMRDLYMRQQDLLLKREFAKTTHLNERKSMESECATIQGIHRMALHSLIHREKQSRYVAEDAEKFGIDLNSPAMVMLQVVQDGPQKMFQWPHQTIKEFHAANAVKNQTIMYLIASRSELNEVTKFIFSSLFKSDPEFVKELVTAVLILQSTNPSCTKSKWKRMRNAFSKHACTDILRVKKSLKELDIDNLLRKDSDDAPDVRIRRLDKIQACLRGSDWVIKNWDVFFTCLESIAEECLLDEDTSRLLADVTYTFLPSIYSERNNLDEESSEDEDETLLERVSTRLSKIGQVYRSALLPAKVGYTLLKYKSLGLTSKFAAYIDNSSDDSDDISFDEDEPNCIHVYLGNIKDVITDISHPSAKQFRKGCGSVDFVFIQQIHEGDEYDCNDPADIDVWTEILRGLKRIFKAKKGIIIPYVGLTDEYIVEMSKKLKIKVYEH